MKKKKLNLRLPRAPLPRQIGGAHKAAKGGKWERGRFRRETRRRIAEE